MKSNIIIFALVAGLVFLRASAGYAQNKTAEQPWRKIQLDKEFRAECVNCGDFNRDGVMDIVAGPYWYEGPDFKKKHEIYQPNPYDWRNWRVYSAHTQPCYTGDFNGDGWLDVLYIERESDGWKLVWYENPAGKDIPWKRHLALQGSCWNESPVWADVEGNGRPAFVTQHDGAVGYVTYDPAKPEELWVFHPVSEPKFWKGFMHGIGCGSIKGNGRADIVISTGWYEHPANPADPWIFHPFKFADAGAQMYVYDVDGDGLNDVVTVWHCHNYGLVWWKQGRGAKGEITWTKNEILPCAPDLNSPALRISQMHAMTMADIMGNGSLDIVTGKRFWAHGPAMDAEPGAPAVVYWFELRHNKDKTVEFIPHLIDSDSGVGSQVTAVDLIGDKHLSILTNNRKGTYLFINPMVASKLKGL